MYFLTVKCVKKKKLFQKKLRIPNLALRTGCLDEIRHMYDGHEPNLLYIKNVSNKYIIYTL